MAKALAALDAQCRTIDRLFKVAGLVAVPQQARYAAVLAMLVVPIVALLVILALGEDPSTPATDKAAKNKPAVTNKKGEE